MLGSSLRGRGKASCEPLVTRLPRKREELSLAHSLSLNNRRIWHQICKSVQDKEMKPIVICLKVSGGFIVHLTIVLSFSLSDVPLAIQWLFFTHPCMIMAGKQLKMILLLTVCSTVYSSTALPAVSLRQYSAGEILIESWVYRGLGRSVYLPLERKSGNITTPDISSVKQD